MKRQRRRSCLLEHQKPFQHEDGIVSAAPSSQNSTNNYSIERRRKNGFNNDSCMDIIAQREILDRQKLRYNNIIPDFQTYNRLRTPERLFPQPANFGWTFTGSSEKDVVEFYEKESELGRVLLDFYFASGTIRVVLVHDEEGEMLLFKKGKSLLPDIYRNVLDDPIANTDAKFRRRGTPRMIM